MRGKVQQLPDRFRFLGITPAYAGKSCAILWNTHRKKDHPRLCGEKKILAESWTCVLGSPPPMRGKG